MKALTRMKLVAAAVLALSLLLPVSSCTRYVDPDGHNVGILGAGPPRHDSRPILDYSYPLTSFRPTILVVLAYMWPLLFSLLGVPKSSAHAWLRRAAWLVQIPLVAGTAWLLATLLMWGDPAIGFYVASSALVVYAGAWLASGVVGWRAEPEVTNLTTACS